MIQIIQHQRSGKLSLENVPFPSLRHEGIIVKNHFSLISSGTERSAVTTAQASLAGKARARPDLVQQVMDNFRREGLANTVKKVKTKLDSYRELGYSSAGVVVDSSVSHFKAGDRVACAGFAHHAEYVSIPKNLAVSVPENVSLDEAAFTTLGAIAMQGVRQSETRVGEVIAVIGLGLIGLITVQILKAAGCRVIGLDIDKSNFELAKRLGCDDCFYSGSSVDQKIEYLTSGIGVDSVIITAGTKSNQPVKLATEIARQKSIIVVVGDVNMNVPRSPFYEKELDLRISCSYGPGRYDSVYEENGVDYPVGYVRWTENRNMQSFLDLVSAERINVRDLVTHTYPISDALKAYDLISGKDKQKYLGILLSYDKKDEDGVSQKPSYRVTVNPQQKNAGDVGIGFIGAGNFAKSYLLPNLVKLPVNMKGVVTQNSVNAKNSAKQFNFEYCTTNIEELLADETVNTVCIGTRHDSHADLVGMALKANKNVFVEKPLAVNEKQLKELHKIYSKQNSNHLLVGFNRRFSAPFTDIKSFFSDRKEPLAITYRVNAGFIPKDHWVYDPKQGGRIIGEACHFIDVMQFLTGSLPVAVYAAALRSIGQETEYDDSVSVSIKFTDGSIGNLIYFSNGNNLLSKEYCEVYSEGRVAVMNDFKNVQFYQGRKKTNKKYGGDKGHKEEMTHFVNLIKGKEVPQISFESMWYTTRTTFKIMESIKKGKELAIG